LQADARLDRLATWVIENPSRNTAPTTLEWGARRLGLYDPHFAVLTQLTTRPAPVADAVRPALLSALAAHPLTHFGIAQRTEQGQQRWLIVLSERRVRLDSVPTSLPVGAVLRLRGTLPADFSRGRVELISERRRMIVPIGERQELSVQVPTAHAGVHRVSVVASGEHGDEVLAKLPIYVGMAFGAATESAPNAVEQDLGAVERAVFASINRERSRAGLAPLQRDPRLDGLARQHNTDMQTLEVRGRHAGPVATATQRVEQAGLPTTLVLETVARAALPDSLQAGDAAPPSELHNALSQSITRVGVGVALEHDAVGPLWVVTELFAEFPERIELASAKPELLSMVNAARVKRGAATVALDSGLCALAGQAAERFVRDPAATEQTVLAATDRELGHFSLAYRRVHSVLVLARRLQDAAALEPGLDPAARGLGIGIAQGERAGASVLAVVLLVGTQR
jgi:uncharacterized protein YkwD